jgi:Flp pilus assembly protein TadG
MELPMCIARAFSRRRLSGGFHNTLARAARAFIGNERGASIVIVGLALPALVGAMGLAAEISYWHLHHRAMQNAADAAAIAAATNSGANYATEAKAVAANYGFTDGSGSISVSATNPATAPGCSANCYVVSVTDQVPLFLSQVVGYTGSTTANGKRVTTITASAVAMAKPAYAYCIVALAGSGAAGITAHGVPDANLNGCNVMSNTSADCTGHDLNAHFGDAHTTSSGCGATQHSGRPIASDPYAALASNIPANSCNGAYPQEPSGKNDPALPASNQWSGSYASASTTVVCGDQQLVGNTTLNNTVLVIENGQLDTNGFTLSGTGLTVVFTGTNGGGYQHIPTGGGTLDITAPTSGAWSGVAIYQDPNLNTNVNISAAGNTPTWDISGMVYLPHSSVTLSGAVNKSSNGDSCFNIVVDNITINGTGDIYANNDQQACKNAGLNTQIEGGDRGTLVN